VQHRSEANASAEVFWVGAIVINVSAAALSKQVVDDRLVVIGEVGDRSRQGEDDMEIEPALAKAGGVIARWRLKAVWSKTAA
jgi:hypothetical protein